MTNASAVTLKTFKFKDDEYTVWTTQNAKGDHYIFIDSESTWNHHAKIIFPNDSYVRRRVIDGHSSTGTRIRGVCYKDSFDIHFVDPDNNDHILHMEPIYWA